MATFWQAAPSERLIPNLRRYRERVLDAIEALAAYFAARMESYAKANAPWRDRTSAARQGLRAFVVRAATSVVIYLVHSVRYGIWLEVGTSKARPYPIILPTIQAFHAPILDSLRRLVGG